MPAATPSASVKGGTPVEVLFHPGEDHDSSGNTADLRRMIWP